MYKKTIVATDLSSEALDLVATTGNLKGFGVEKILLIAFWDALDLLGIDTFFKAIIYKDLENNLKGKKEVLEDMDSKSARELWTARLLCK